MTSIAEKYAAQWMPNGEVSLADLIQEAINESKSVAVMGEVVAWGVTKRYEDNVWFISDSRFTAQHYANLYAHRIGNEPDQVVVPLYAKPTHSIPAAELDALRKDAARYRWLREQYWNSADICVVRNPKEAVKLGHDCPSFERLDSFIDAAIAQGKGE